MRVVVKWLTLTSVAALLSGCPDVTVDTGVSDTDTDDTDVDTGVTETGDTDVPPPDPCLTPAPLPLSFTTLTGFSLAEDFDFDGEGHHVSIVDNGNLLGEDLQGNTKIISPNVAQSAAGTRILPNGDWVVCNVGQGSLVRVAASGAKQTILSGLNYPNGLEVDLDGFVYVAEQNSGQVRRVDPTTGDFEVIGTGLSNPNGLTFSPDYQTLYVGSFGAGTVTSITRKVGKDEWELPRQHANVADVVAGVIDPCVGQSVGEECYMLKGGVGVCDDSTGPLRCEGAKDAASCVGKSAGDSCSTVAMGRSYSSECVDPGGVQDIFCPRVDLVDLESCQGSSPGSSCSVGGADGVCMNAFDGVAVCMTEDDQQSLLDTCDTLNKGDVCEGDVATGVFQSWCTDLDDWGVTGTGCKLPSWKINVSGGGGLDGINADECNNVYVTEYTTGHVYRVRPSGTVHKAVTLPSFWIPNMRWSQDVGGWDPTRLYVSDRGQGRLFAIDLGHGPRELPYKAPPATP